MFELFRSGDFRLILLRMIIIAVPCYAVAFATGKVVFVVPTIAMMMMVASAVESGQASSRNRVDGEENIETDNAANDIVDAGTGT